MRKETAVWAAATVLLSTVLVSTSTVADAAPVRKGPSFQQQNKHVGAYKVSGQRLYRMIPTKKAPKTAKPTGELPYTANRARAAWILSNYGGTGTKVQAAAVDVAVLSLLAPKKYGLKKKAAKKRIRRSGQMKKYVRSYARQMLASSHTQAGPYTATLTPSAGATVGSGTTLQMSVRNRSGRGVSGAAVTFSYGGQVASARTGPSGVAVATVVTAPGATAASAVVSGLPATRVQTWAKPKKRKNTSPLVGASRTGTLTASTSVTGSAPQSVGVVLSASSVRVGDRTGGRFLLTGGVGPRAVTQQVVGGYATSSFTCATAPSMSSSTRQVPAAGEYELPTYVPTASGYYRVAVRVDGNQFTGSASACSDPFRVQAASAIWQYTPAGQTQKVRVGNDMGAAYQTGGFDRFEDHQVVTRMYGPFTDSTRIYCNQASLNRSLTRSVNGNGQWTSPKVTATAAMSGKWFAFDSVLSEGDLTTGATSDCGVVTQVVP